MKFVGIIAVLILFIPVSAYALNYSDEDQTLYFRGSGGSLNSYCDNPAYHVSAIINSEEATPIKIEIVNPNGKVVGIHEETTRGVLEVEIDVDYDSDGQYIIRIHYKGGVYEKDYGWSSVYTPSREEIVQCLVAKEINKNLEMEYQEITLGRDIGDTWKNYGNTEVIKNIIGKEKFDELEPIISIDSVVKQRQGEYRIETNYAIEQAEFLRTMLNDYAEDRIDKNLEIFKKIVSEMDLTTEEKVDVIYERELNGEEAVKNVKYLNDKFVNQIINLYKSLDKNEATAVEATKLELERQEEERLAKQKILDEIGESKERISEELGEIVCPQGFEPINGKCEDKPVIERQNGREIAAFVDKSKDPQYYIDRYNNEPSYKKWFHDNYPQYDSIEQAVGLELVKEIPDWVKNIFVWYGQGQIGDNELLEAIKFLINDGIIIVTD